MNARLEFFSDPAVTERSHSVPFLPDLFCSLLAEERSLIETLGEVPVEVLETDESAGTRKPVSFPRGGSWQRPETAAVCQLMGTGKTSRNRRPRLLTPDS